MKTLNVTSYDFLSRKEKIAGHCSDFWSLTVFAVGLEGDTKPGVMGKEAKQGQLAIESGGR